MNQQSDLSNWKADDLDKVPRYILEDVCGCFVGEKLPLANRLTLRVQNETIEDQERDLHWLQSIFEDIFSSLDASFFHAIVLGITR